MLTREQLLSLAKTIREETEQGMNTAQRVGHILYEIASSFLIKTENDRTGNKLSAEELDVVERLVVIGTQLVGQNNISMENVVSRIHGSQAVDGNSTVSGTARNLGSTYFGSQFVSGLLGKGGFIGPDGAAEMKSLVLREFLEAPEYRLNRVTSVAGKLVQSWCNGTIERVTPLTASTGYFVLKLEDGEAGSCARGDICLGIFHYGNGQDSSEDSDDLRGNITTAGFTTTYFRVDSCRGTKGRIVYYTLRPHVDPETHEVTGYYNHPRPFMKFAGYGNFTNATRQTSIIISHSYIRMVREVDNWEFDFRNIAMQIGELDGLREAYKDEGCPDMTGYSAYLDSIYFTGKIEQLGDSAIESIRDRLQNYNVYISEHVDVITVDDTGNVIGGLWKEETDEDGYVFRDYRIHSAITVRNGVKILTKAPDGEHASNGKYQIYLQPHGCSCQLVDSTLYITAIENVKDGVAGSIDDLMFDYGKMRDTDNCSVDILIDCEGVGTITKQFPITIKHDNEPFVNAGLDNEVSVVSWNTKLQQYVGLPVIIPMHMWKNNAELAIQSVGVAVKNSSNVTVVNVFTRVVVDEQDVSFESITNNAYPYGLAVQLSVQSFNGVLQPVVRITSANNSLPPVTDINITMTALYAGINYESTLIHTLSKNTDANVYSLHPSVSSVVVSGNANVVRSLSADVIRCEVFCDSTDDKHYVVPVASYGTHGLAVLYRVFYNDGTDTGECPYDTQNGVSIDETVSSVLFVLYGIGASGGSGNWVEYDKENIPVVSNGQDGVGVEFVFLADGDFNDWNGDRQSMPDIRDDSNDSRVDEGETKTRKELFQCDGYRPYTTSGDFQWSVEPNGVSEDIKFEFYAQRKKVNGLWQPFGAVRMWSRYGESLYMLDLSNDNSFINCDSNHNLLPGATYEQSEVLLFKGSSYAYDLFDIYVTPHNILCNGNSGRFLLTADRSGSYILVPSQITADAASIDVEAFLKSDYDIRLSTCYKIVKNIPGMGGADAISYSIIPSVNVIHKNADGTYRDASVSIQVNKVAGTIVTPLTTKTLLDAENLVLTYQGSHAQEQQVNDPTSLSTSMLCGTALFTKLFLRKTGNNVILDSERINVVTDGTDGVTYEIRTDVDSVTIDKDSTSARLAAVATFNKKIGDDSVSLFSCYGSVYRRAGENYIRIGASTAKSTQYQIYSQEVSCDVRSESYADAIVFFMTDTPASSQQDASAAPSSYLAKKEIVVLKNGDTGPSGEANFHEIIACGSRNQSETPSQVKIDGEVIGESNDRGLTLTVISGDFSIEFQQTYDVWEDGNGGNTTLTDQLISALSSYGMENKIVILTSYDAIYIHDRLWAKLANEYGVGQDIRTAAKSRAIAIVAQRGLSVGKALVEWSDTEDFVLVQTSVANGVMCVLGDYGVQQGENLLRQTDFRFMSAWNKRGGTVIPSDFQGCNAYLIEQPSSNFSDDLEQVLCDSNGSVLKNGTWYTLSFYARGGTIRTHLYPSVIDTSERVYVDGVASPAMVDGMTDWVLDEVYRIHTYTFKTKAALSEGQPFAATEKLLWRKYANTNGDVYLCLPKLEEGVYATKWQSKEEDRKGLSGCRERMFEVFTPGMTYYNEDNDLKEGVRYIDFYMKEDSSTASGYRVFQCLETHVAAATFSDDSTHWIEVSVNAASAFFRYLIAKNANIKILSSSQFTIVDPDNSVVAGFANASIPLWVGSSAPANAPFRVLRNGKLYATGAEISGKITATEGTIGGFTITATTISSINGSIVLNGSTGTATINAGYIGGFSISGSGLTHIVSQAEMSPSSNMGYIICRNDYYGRFAGIGANVLPSSVGSTSAVARFENTDTNSWLNTNIALLLRAENGTYANFAFHGTGNGILNGWIGGYKYSKVSLTSENTIYDGYIPLKENNTWIVWSSFSNSGIALPKLSEVRRAIGIGSSTNFCVRLLICADLNSTGFQIYGRNNNTSSNNTRPWSTLELPLITHWDGSNWDFFGMGDGDSVEFLLIYDSSRTATINGYDTKYTARIINRQD